MKQYREPLLAIRLRDTLSMLDVCTLFILALYSLLSLVFYAIVENASENILMNCTIATTVIALGIGDKLHGGRFFKFTRQFYIVPIIYLMYTQVHSYIGIFHSQDYDDLLIAWDYAIFGVNPTEWLYQYSFPALTEYLQFTYMLFYLMPVMQALELYCKDRYTVLKQFAYIIALGYFVSHLLYFFLPAVGPRFTLHDFAAIDLELPGLWLAETFRTYVNAGGNIAADTPDPLAVVHRDCMPSGHTMVTLINIALGFRFHSSLRWVFLVIGSSLIFSTVYLRYHYVVDLFAGAVFAALVLIIAPKLHRWVRQKYLPDA